LAGTVQLGPIASLTLGLLQRKRSSRQAAMMMTIQVMAIPELQQGQWGF
jgi:hypothetical protein